MLLATRKRPFTDVVEIDVVSIGPQPRAAEGSGDRLVLIGEGSAPDIITMETPTAVLRRARMRFAQSAWAFEKLLGLHKPPTYYSGKQMV